MQSIWHITSVLYSLCSAKVARSWLVQTCSPHNTYFQKHPDQNGESRHLESWEFEPQLCWYPKTQHWFDDLKLFRNTSFSSSPHHPVTTAYGSKQHQNIQGNHAVQKHGPTEWNFITAVKYPLKKSTQETAKSIPANSLTA